MVKLFIGNLPDGFLVSNEDVRPLFEAYGTVSECEVIRNYGFVHIDTDEAAEKAIKELNGKMVKGRPMKVEKSESKGPKKPSQKVFCGNVADGTTNEQLRGLFETYCEVMEADVITGKNYGFVHIDSTIGKQKINEIVGELNGYELNGNALRVQLSTSGLRPKPGMAGDGCFNMRGGRGGRGGPRGYPGGYGGGFGGGRGGGGRGGRGGPRGGGGRDGGYGRRDYGRNAPYPPPRSGGYTDFAEDTYDEPMRRGGGPMRGPDPYGGRSGGYGGGGRSGGYGNEMFSRRSPPRSGGGAGYGSGGYGGGGYSGGYSGGY